MDLHFVHQHELTCEVQPAIKVHSTLRSSGALDHVARRLVICDCGGLHLEWSTDELDDLAGELSLLEQHNYAKHLDLT